MHSDAEFQGLMGSLATPVPSLTFTVRKAELERTGYLGCVEDPINFNVNGSASVKSLKMIPDGQLPAQSAGDDNESLEASDSEDEQQQKQTKQQDQTKYDIDLIQHSQTTSAHPQTISPFDPEAFVAYLKGLKAGLHYSTSVLHKPNIEQLRTRMIKLPVVTRINQRLLFLDLDETLIHSCLTNEKPQATVTAILNDNSTIKIGINLRPYLRQFLSTVAKHFSIYIFTASQTPYAKAIVHHFDPNGHFIQGILTREHCLQTLNGHFIKDLRIIANCPMSSMLIIDNMPHSFGFQIENGIPIIGWHNDPHDCELKYLARYLVAASHCEDLRMYNSQLKLLELLDYSL